MRILYLSPYYKPAFSFGGPVRSISATCEALARTEASVKVLTTLMGGIRSQVERIGRPVQVDGVEVTYFSLLQLPLGVWCSPSWVRAMRAAVPAVDVVVLESLWSLAAFATVRACARAGRPFVLVTRGQLLPWAVRSKGLKKQVFLRLIGRRILKRAAALICTDEVEAAAVRALTGRDRVHVVPNGIDLDHYSEPSSPNRLREEVGIPPGATVLAFVGRLTAIKRPDLAVRCIGRMREAGRDAHLLIVGPDQDGIASSLLELARSLGCAEACHILGLKPADEIIPVYGAADLVLVPTEVQENFGMVAAEALACGTPVLTTPGVPVGRVAAEQGVGRVADPAEFVDACVRIFEDESWLEDAAGRARQVAAVNFSVRSTAERIRSILSGLVNERQIVSAAGVRGAGVCIGTVGENSAEIERR